jgi:HK97 family phage portal protein
MKIPFTKKELRLFSVTQMDTALDMLINGKPSATGVNVNQSTAMSCVAYLAGVRLISETVGQLPLIEYQRLKPRGKERATNRVLYRLLHDSPNPEMSAMSFKETMQGHAITWGNAFAEIQWDPDGTPVALWPLMPNMMQVGRDKETNELIYAYRLPDGTTAKLPAWRVWHMPGFGYDGIIGYDTIYLAREAIGMALAMEEFGARFFGNGASPGGVITHPNKLTKESQEKLKTSWNEGHQGLSNQHRIAILEEGMSWQATGIPPENAQFLESRKFQLGEIARLLHVPPHMLADLDRATFTNIEHQGIEFVTYTLEPWFVRWEQTCYRKLLQPFERNIFFFEFLADALLKGDSASRMAAYKEMFYMGALSPNDIREKENMNPIDEPNADKYFVQANMVPIDMAGKQPVQPPAPAVPADDPNAKVGDVVRMIADRDKANIIKGFERDPVRFRAWVEDYYKDFEPFMAKQIAPLAKNGHREIAEKT